MKYNAETGPTDGERTSGYEFMKHRIRKILLVCCSYDGYILEEDGHIEQQINQEYIDLNMSNPPALLRVSSTAEALDLLREDDRFDFILTMYNVGEPDVFDFAKIVKERHRHIPVVLLTSFSKDIYRRIDERDASGIDYIFSWSGNTDLVIGIIKLIEDAMNAEEDILTGGVQAILLVEDSVRFYSTYLPALYKLILQQNTEFLKDAFNEQQQILRKRARPKILLATNYADAVALYERYKKNLLGVISDVGFVLHKGDSPSTEKLDAGIDLSLFGQKLEVTFDWFRKVTDDMIVNVPSTPSSGLLAAPMNVGKAEVKGYEIGVGFNHSFTKDIDFSINLGYSYNKSKWLEITNDELINGNTIYRKGHAIKEYYGYQADHLLTQDDLDFRVPIIGGYDGATTAQLPGDIRYVDTNGDKVITTDDRVPLGDQDPHSVYYGNLSFRWKNLDFDMQVNGVGYVPIFYQGLISNPLDPEYGGTPQRWHLDHWKAENPDRNAKLPRVTTDPGNNALLSTFWKENGAFVRIKYMQLGYNFKALAKKIHAGNFRVYVNVQNPFTFTKVELIDPETKGTHTTYPMFKTYSVGLNVNF